MSGNQLYLKTKLNPLIFPSSSVLVFQIKKISPLFCRIHIKFYEAALCIILMPFLKILFIQSSDIPVISHNTKTLDSLLINLHALGDLC